MSRSGDRDGRGADKVGRWRGETVDPVSGRIGDASGAFAHFSEGAAGQSVKRAASGLDIV